MANDYITLNALACELNDMLTEGKVNKINVLDESSFLIAIRAKGANHSLFLSSNSSLPSIYLTKHKYESLDSPTNFCMLLRKHLSGGTVENIALLNRDRVFCLSITARNELYDTTKFSLILEYMGARSNIILLDHENRIIDATKRIFEGNHTIIPNQIYTPPLKCKPDLYDEPCINQIASLSKSEYYNALTKNVVGLSKETAREISYLSETASIVNVLDTFKNIYNSARFKPAITERGVFVYPYSTLECTEIESYEVLSYAFDEYYAKINAEQKKAGETKEIRAKLKRLRSRLDKRMHENLEKLAKKAEIEPLLQKAEILKCNLHNIKAGYSILNCFDFYNTIDIDLPIDPSLSPKLNLESYYKRYNKLKGMIAYAENEKDDLKNQNEYLLSIEEGLKNSTCKSDYNDLKKEIDALLPKKKANLALTKKPKKPQKVQLLNLDIDGFKTYVGKTNLQNQEITFNIAKAEDIWLHVKNHHGSHTLIISNNKEIPKSVIEKAASYAAFYSGARNESKAEVDYTKRKFVKRLHNSPLVTYSNQKTVIVDPVLFDKP